MKPVKLAGLEPETLFGYFEKLCSIPHGSGNTKAISDYFLSFAQEHGLRSHRDEGGNVILFKDASAGYEDHPPVILQAHMDMVCQKEEGCTRNMETEPLDVTHDGTYVYAEGTSLGADDGAGVAMCLTILSDDTLEHPALEVVFTNDEEVGLVGANAADLSMLKGRQLINLDGATDTTFVAGCAGGARVTLQMPLTSAPCSQAVLDIRLDGLHGGHSGGLIHMNFANANKEMAKLLQQLREQMALRIVSFAGGTAGNAIPRSCQAQIALDAADVPKAKALCKAFIEELKNTYDEPEALMSAQLLDEGAQQAYTAECSDAIIGFLMELPNGMLEWNEQFKIPMTSLNLGITKTGEYLNILTNVRSNVNKKRQNLQDQLKTIGEKYGCTYSQSGVYSAWEYREDSPLRDTMVAQYKQMNGKDPVIRVTHAGLECGVFGEKLPGLDCVCAGCNMRYIHTAQEVLEIASFGKVLNYFKQVLKSL